MSDLVLDLTRHFPGPMCTKFLQTMGLRVRRIVSPRPDLLQEFSPAAFEWITADKENEAVDLKTAAGVERLRELVKEASALVENNLPGKMESMGVGPEQLRAINPRLTYVRITGYSRAQERTMPGHDLTYLATAGLLPQVEAASRNIPLADLCGAFWAAMGVLNGIRIGGGFYEVSLEEASLTLAWPHIPFLDGSRCCYAIYPAAEGRVALAALEPHFWERFCAAIARPEWKHGAYSSTTEDNDVYREMCAEFRSRTAEEWDRWALEHQIPLRAVREEARPFSKAPWEH